MTVRPTSLKTACLRVALGIALFFAADAAIFRSGFYFRLVAPASGLGNVARMLDNVRRLPPTREGVVQRWGMGNLSRDELLRSIKRYYGPLSMVLSCCDGKQRPVESSGTLRQPGADSP